MEVVDKVALGARGANDRPRDPVKINAITVEEK
jgi:hypothetical protein